MATMNTSLKIKDFLHERPKPSGLDVVCKLQNFAIITYAVSPERFNGLIPPRFKLDTVVINGEEKALISVVPFIDVDFTSAVVPFPKFRMGQTNYRVYIIDTKTQERCVWFLGTTLDSWTVMVPRFFWKLPWHSERSHLTVNIMRKNSSSRVTKCKQKRNGRLLVLS